MNSEASAWHCRDGGSEGDGPEVVSNMARYRCRRCGSWRVFPGSPPPAKSNFDEDRMTPTRHERIRMAEFKRTMELQQADAARRARAERAARRFSRQVWQECVEPLRSLAATERVGLEERTEAAAKLESRFKELESGATSSAADAIALTLLFADPVHVALGEYLDCATSDKRSDWGRLQRVDQLDRKWGRDINRNRPSRGRRPSS